MVAGDRSPTGIATVALASTPAAFDQGRLWEAVTHHPTGVAVVTAVHPDGERVAMVVGSFTSISMDPALVGFFATVGSSSYARLQECDSFVINILSHSQEDVCRALSRKGVSDKLQGVACSDSPLGSPVITGAVAWFECTRAASLGIGDHDLVVGALQSMDVPNPVLPLLYFQGSLGQYRSTSLVLSGEDELLPAVAAVERTRTLLEELAAELDREVVVFARLGNEIVAIASAGEQPDRATGVIGRRFPFAPPFGALLLDSEEEAAAWLDRSRGEHDADEWRLRISRAHERAASLALLSEEHRSFDEIVEQFSRGGHTPQDRRRLLGVMRELEAEYEPDDELLRSGRPLRLAQVRARVRGVDVLLSAHGIAEPIDSAAAPRMLETMRDCARSMEAL